MHFGTAQIDKSRRDTVKPDLAGNQGGDIQLSLGNMPEGLFEFIGGIAKHKLQVQLFVDSH